MIDSEAKLKKILGLYAAIVQETGIENSPSLCLHNIPLEWVNKQPFRIKNFKAGFQTAEHPRLPGLDLFIKISK